MAEDVPGVRWCGRLRARAEEEPVQEWCGPCVHGRQKSKCKECCGAAVCGGAGKQRTNNGEACKASRAHPADMDRGASEASGAHPTETTLTGLADAVMLVDQFLAEEH